MCLDQVAGDGQAQSTAAGIAAASTVGAIKALKDERQFVGRTALVFAALLAFCVVSLAIGIWMMNRALGKAERGNGVGMVV